jgi:hypothetical protein
MLTLSPSSRQPLREPWTLARFDERLAFAVGSSLDSSSRRAYHSHLQSYISFCDIHGFDYDPTPLTLARYVVYMSHYIQPRSVSSYLSGICNRLESTFPHVRLSRRHSLVSRALAGCLRQLGSPPNRKSPLAFDNLLTFFNAYPSPSHDDLLFLAITFCGFFGLHRLGELVDPDFPAHQLARKRILRSSVSLLPDHFSYHLPTHKADRFFEGNVILIMSHFIPPVDPLLVFSRYLDSRDDRAPLLPYLWLDSSLRVPTRSWYLQRLHSFLPHSFGGHSLRSGGATFFASQGWTRDRIQALGRWASDAFEVYIRKHPALLQALSPST